MRLNIDRDLVKQLVSGQLPNNSRHLDELTHEPPIWQCDTGQLLSCFDSSQLTISWMANVKDVDLLRHAWDTPPFLLIVSPTLPGQSVDAYVRTLGQSRDNQKKRGWPYSMSMRLCPTRASCAREPRYYEHGNGNWCRKYTPKRWIINDNFTRGPRAGKAYSSISHKRA